MYPSDIDAALEAARASRAPAAHAARTSATGPPTPGAVAAHLRRVSATKEDDEVASLPDVEALGSRQYSGFLAVNRYEDEEVSDALHYWHVEAEHADPDEAPLVVWLTGGPGGSSVGAALTEHGVRTPARDVDPVDDGDRSIFRTES